MLYDLSKTRLARSTVAIAVPTEGELLALQVALMLLQDCAFDELIGCSLTLTEGNLESVARIIEKRLPTLARDIGRGSLLRTRLSELVGIEMTRIRDGSVFN